MLYLGISITLQKSTDAKRIIINRQSHFNDSFIVHHCILYSNRFIHRTKSDSTCLCKF